MGRFRCMLHVRTVVSYLQIMASVSAWFFQETLFRFNAFIIHKYLNMCFKRITATLQRWIHLMIHGGSMVLRSYFKNQCRYADRKTNLQKKLPKCMAEKNS